MKAKTNVSLLLTALLLVSTVFAYYHQGGGDEPVTEGRSSEPTTAAETRQPEPKAASAESKEQRLERMFSAFDRTQFQRGHIIVSFTEGTTKEQARRILSRFDLGFATSRVCSPEVLEQPQAASCSQQEEWNENLQSATVTVPAGQEKTYAQRLIGNNAVIWIEPELINTPAEETAPAQGIEPQETESVTTASKRSPTILYVAIGLFVAIVLYFLLRKKK